MRDSCSRQVRSTAVISHIYSQSRERTAQSRQGHSGVIRNRVNQLGLWAAGFVVREWGIPWFLQEEAIGLFE